ncbi:MAG: DegT/DnrJ/EryC1/StrS family aminotransferase, partial [Planctomycetes bacterium]|nr:DegT/DnrJ/EryC1/StrS family aminotransferase [Planctomycetota bacterium]
MERKTMREVRMLDLKSEHDIFAEDVRAVVDTVLSSQQFIGGPFVSQLETELAARIGVRTAVAVNSGTDALLCALMALEIGPGDEVIVPTFTFFATAGAVHRVGAKPVFVDIDPRTFNIAPEILQAAITERTRAIIAVHLFGQCADMDAINALATTHKLKVIEDAAQALGATYRGRNACTFSDLACVSFYPTKNLGGYGEGGMIFAKDEALANIARQLRSHGESERYVHERVGGNFRLDTMKAGILLAKLPYWDDFTDRRRSRAKRYDELLNGEPLITPFVSDDARHVYHQYSVLCSKRDELRSFLGDRGVQSG